MIKQEYEEWWRETCIKAREAGLKELEEHPDALTCCVPYFKPFYTTTKENTESKQNKQLANALASIHGELEPYPEESMVGFVEVTK